VPSITAVQRPDGPELDLHILAGEGRAFVERDHAWHLERIERRLGPEAEGDQPPGQQLPSIRQQVGVPQP
jgi:hypothetical protein